MTRYRLILADPPWQYRNDGIEGAARSQYPTMPTVDICALPISALADKSAVLLLWATWPQMVDAMRVISSWGFSYVSGFPWIKIHGEPARNLWGDYQIKPRYGMGWWVRSCSELLLIAKRGDAVPPEEYMIGLLSEQFGHSRKPENIYQYAELFPGPYLELFARRKRAGWDVFGNEVDGSIALPEAA